MTTTLNGYTTPISRTASVLVMTTKKKWTRVFGLSALTLALCSCQTFLNIPPQQTEPTIAHPNIPTDETGYEAYDNQAVPSGLAALRWQDFYTDDRLKSLIALGLENNKDVRQTVLAIKRARAQYRIADNRDLPVINGNGTYRRGSEAGGQNAANNYSVALGMASYELDFWGRIDSLKDQALQSYLATTAASETAQLSLIANIARSYITLSYQLQQLQLAARTLESREESLRITTARLAAGIDERSPSLRAAASVEQARVAALNAQTAVLQARNALKYLVGAPITEDMLPEPAVSSVTTDKILSAGLPSDLLLYRPDVLQAEYDLKAAGANIEVARAAYYPTISLTGDFGYRSGKLSDLFSSSATSWSFGPSFNVPLFDAGQRDANYEVAQIEREQALANYEQTIENAFREVNDVLAVRATLAQRLASQYRLQENYNQILQIAQARFSAQVDDYLNVLEAERTLFDAQQAILRLEQESLHNNIELYEALGGGANLVEPVAIPTSEHRNLIRVLDRPNTEQKAAAAIDAASAPALVTPVQVDNIIANQPVEVVEETLKSTVDLDKDGMPDAFIAEIESTIYPAGTQVIETEDGVVIERP